VGFCVYDNCISIDGVKGLEIGELYVIKTQLSIIPFAGLKVSQVEVTYQKEEFHIILCWVSSKIGGFNT